MRARTNFLILLIMVSLSFSTGCAAVIKNTFSTPDTKKKYNGYLIRGDGWKDWKYRFAIDNVNQIDNEDYIIAVKINNYNESFWATGIWIVPFIPLFGIPQSGYNGEVNKGISGVNISIAIFMKNNENLSIDPCKIKLLNNNQTALFPISYRYSFNNNKASCNCDQTDTKKIIEINEKFYDILEFELTYGDALFPQNNINIIFPDFLYNNNKIQLPSFKFNKGTGIIWTSIL